MGHGRDESGEGRKAFCSRVMLRFVWFPDPSGMGHGQGESGEEGRRFVQELCCDSFGSQTLPVWAMGGTRVGREGRHFVQELCCDSFGSQTLPVWAMGRARVGRKEGVLFKSYAAIRLVPIPEGSGNQTNRSITLEQNVLGEIGPRSV